jgi:hypothetical protein
MEFWEPHGSLRSWCLGTEGFSNMANFHVTLDALVFALPMVLILFAVFFRLDELIVRPKKSLKRRPTASGWGLSGWDKDGHVVCVDPDGSRESETHRKQ